MIHTDGTPTVAHKAADATLEGEEPVREVTVTVTIFNTCLDANFWREVVSEALRDHTHLTEQDLKSLRAYGGS